MIDIGLQSVVILLGVSVITVAVFRRFHLPPILAYLFVGVLVGPYGWGWFANSEDVRALAEIGIVFLLFTVGLEFSLPQLTSMRMEVLGLGGAQVLFCTIIAGMITWWLGLSAEAAFVIGGTLALSSTALVIKQLTEQLEFNSRHGRLSLGILIFQDLAVIPFLIIIPALSGNFETSVAYVLFIALLKGSAILLIMLAVGHWLLRPLFHEIAQIHSSELFTLTVLLFSLAAAWITHLFGLSLALGAFLAGMMLSETEFRHQVETDIRPFRDVLLGLFFITVGMLLDINTLPSIIHWVLLLVISIIVIKTALITILSRLIGAEPGVALRTGLVLAQGGEFGFALLALAVSGGILTQEPTQIILAAIILSMAISPAIIKANGKIAKRVYANTYAISHEQQQDILTSAQPLNQHILICGYGRVGQNIARFLEKEGFDYFALDLDALRVREAQEAGERVNYGDPTHREVLEAAGIKRAKALVISYSDTHVAHKIIVHAKAMQPELPILVRTKDDADLEALLSAGATEVVPEIFEASLMLSSNLLLLLDVPMQRVMRHIQEVRKGRYELFRQFFHGQDIHDVSEAGNIREGLHSITLPNGAHAIGKTLAELNLYRCHVTVTAIRRGKLPGPHPTRDTCIKEGDTLVLYGTPENIQHVEAILLSG